MQTFFMHAVTLLAVILHSADALHGLNVDLTCQECNSSFYCSAGNSFPCPQNSRATSWPASQITECICNNGYQATAERDGCIVGVSPFYYENGVAKSCHGNLRETIHQQAESEYDCVCPPGYYGGPGSGACTQCQAGFYAESFNTSICSECPAFSHSAEGQSHQSACVCNAGYTGANGGPCEACAAGTFKEARGSSACLLCAANTHAASAAAACTECRGNSSAPEGSTSEQACLCVPGFYQRDGACSMCAEGRFKNETSNAPCSLCARGAISAVPGALECVACLANSQSLPSEGGAKCVCSAGYYQADVALARPSCQPCAVDTYQHLTGSTSCSECPVDSSSALAAPALYACICRAGLFEFDQDTGACAPCAPGSYKEQALDNDGDFAACDACEENKTTVPGALSVEQCVCKRGFYGAGDACLACAAGSFKNTTGAAECAPCPESSFSVHNPVQGTLACSSCAEALGSPFGITRRDSSVSVDACVCNASMGYGDGAESGCALCGTGTSAEYEDADEYIAPTSVCVDCAEGKYADVQGLVACKTCRGNSSSHPPRVRCVCDAGYTFDDFAASTLALAERVSGVCKACAPSTFKDAVGDQECSPCAPDSQSPSASSAATACLCSTGFSGPAGGECTPCAANTFAAEVGMLACAQCPAHSVAPEQSDENTDCLCDVGHTGPDGGTCAACEPGKYKTGPGSAACANCAVGTFLESTGATSAAACVACAAGKFSTAEGAALASTCVNCPADTYSTAEGAAAASTCELCPASSSSLSGSSALTACLCNLGFAGNDGGPCQECNVGTYKDGLGSAACSQCAENSTSLSASVAATNCLCLLGFSGPHGGPCAPCAANTYSAVLGSASCAECPADAASPEQSDALTDCRCGLGFYGPDGGVCAECAENTYADALGTAACADCAVHSEAPRRSDARTDCVCSLGFFGPAGGPCAMCPVNTYANALSTGECAACPANSQALAGSDARSDCLCSLGFFGPHGGPCTECPANEYADALNTSACTACLANSEAPTRSDAREDCRCSLGFYGPHGGPCNECPLNEYADAVGMAACELCLEHSEAPAGSDARSDCLCSLGFYGPPGGSCTECPVNEYADRLNMSACTACLANSEALAGSDERIDCTCSLGFFGAPGGLCAECPVNNYADALNMSACKACLANSEAPTRSDAREDCRCSLGFYGPHGGPCSECPLNEYADALGLASCSACPANSEALPRSDAQTDCLCSLGFYGAPGGPCAQCPVNSYADALNMSACTACLAHSEAPAGSDAQEDCLCSLGFYGPAGGTCTECPASEYADALDTANCTACPPNSEALLRSDAQTDCLCGLGFYGPPGGPCSACLPNSYAPELNTSLCLACPLNSAAPGASNDITHCECIPGFNGPHGGPCAACAQGTFKPTVGSAPCTNCAEHEYGTHDAAVHETTCVACPEHAHSVAGSRNIAFCFCVPGYKQAEDYSSCVLCDSGEYDSTERFECSQCAGGLYSAATGATGGETCLPCEPGTWSDAGSPTCNLCPQNSNSSAGSALQTDCKCNPGTTGADGSSCVLCVPGTYKENSGSAACSACAEHATSESGSVQAEECLCVPGHFGPAGGACEVCAAHSYANALGMANCTACPAHSEAPLGSDAASDCLCGLGFFGPHGGPCAECAANTYAYALGTAACTACQANSEAPARSDEQTDCLCSLGFFGHAGGPCTTCPVNTFTAEVGMQACEQCPAHSVAPEQSDAQTDCLCSLGFYGPHGGPCTECPVSEYADALNMSACRPCLANSEAPARSDEQTDCLCSLGFFGHAGGPCTMCPVNTFAAEVGMLACVPCPAHSVAPLQSDDRRDCKCTIGFYGHSGGPCTECPVNRYADMIDMLECTACLANSESLSASDAQSDCLCSLGFFGLPGGLCMECPVNKYADTLNMSVCTACLANSEAPVGSDERVDCRCSLGFYGPYGGPCTECPVNAYANALGMASCTACPAGSEAPAGSNAQTDCLCSLGFFGPPGGECTPCAADTFAAEVGMLACAQCPAQSVAPLQSDAETDCRCTLGHSGADGGPCAACEAGEYKDAVGDAACTACPLHSYSAAASPARSSCRCDAGYSGPDGEACAACPPGKYKEVSGSALCTSCLEHSDSPGASIERNSCLCNAGFSGPDGGTCTACAAGTFKEAPGAALCVACSAGKFLEATAAVSADACVACAAGKFSTTVGADSASTCLACAAGSYSTTLGAVHGGTCVSCPPHSQSPAASDALVDCLCSLGFSGGPGGPCVECAANTYADALGTENCTACLNAEAPPRSDALADCFCVPGFSGSAGSCTLCAADTYAAEIGTAVCTACPVNAQAPAGSTSVTACACNVGYTGLNGEACTACAAGSYKDSVGAAACANCAAGKFLEATAEISADACVACAAGKFSTTEGAALPATCIACAPGTYSTTVGASVPAVCLACPADTFSVHLGAALASTCQACPAGSVSEEGSGEQAACRCNAGFTGPDGGECVLCAAGKHKAAVGAAACTACVAGKFSSSEGAVAEATCQACAAGKFSTTAGADSAATCIACAASTFSGVEGAAEESTCTQCPAHSSSPAGSTAVVHCTCNPGYTGLDGGVCAQCPHGTFKSQAGAQPCTLCAADTYGTASAGTNAGVCAQCPEHSSSASGSSAVEFCFCAAGYRQTETHESCIPCSPGFHDSLSRYVCSACAGGLYSAAIGATGVETCQECPAGMWSASGSDTCEPCPPHSNSSRVSAYLSNCTCNAGATGAEGGPCVLCVAGTYKASRGSAACEACPENSVSPSGSSLETSCQCVPGHYGEDGGLCTACPPNTYAPTLGSSHCSACPDNSEAPGASSLLTACLCSAGYVGTNGGTCAGCPASTYKDAPGSASCSSCPANAQALPISTTADSCRCNAGYTGLDGEACTACAAGSYKDSVGEAACVPCAAGKFLEASAADTNACVACSAGTYSEMPGASAEGMCLRCANATYSETVGAFSASTCISCPANSSSPSGSSTAGSCLCNVGYTGPDGGECSACAPGTFKDARGSADCTECAAGSYLTEAGAYLPAQCVNCRQGTFSTTSAATSSETCVACPARSSSTSSGAYSESSCVCDENFYGSGGAACSACPLLQFRPGVVDRATTQADCLCLAGAEPDPAAANLCRLCPVGTYKPDAGDHNCTACSPTLTTEKSGGTNASACVCAPGRGYAGDICETCLANHYKAGYNFHTCLPCRDHAFAHPGSTASSDCLCGPGSYIEVPESFKTQACMQYTAPSVASVSAKFYPTIIHEYLHWVYDNIAPDGPFMSTLKAIPQSYYALNNQTCGNIPWDFFGDAVVMTRSPACDAEKTFGYSPVSTGHYLGNICSMAQRFYGSHVGCFNQAPYWPICTFQSADAPPRRPTNMPCQSAAWTFRTSAGCFEYNQPHDHSHLRTCVPNGGITLYFEVLIGTEDWRQPMRSTWVSIDHSSDPDFYYRYCLWSNGLRFEGTNVMPAQSLCPSLLQTGSHTFQRFWTYTKYSTRTTSWCMGYNNAKCRDGYNDPGLYGGTPFTIDEQGVCKSASSAYLPSGRTDWHATLPATWLWARDYKNDPQAFCELCPVGYYKNSSSHLRCSKCPINYATNTPGSLACEPCPPHSSTHQRLGQARCFCDAGFEEDDASALTNTPQCSACAPGTFNTAEPAGDAFLRTCIPCGTCGDSVQAGRLASECTPARNTSCRPCQAYSAPEGAGTLLWQCLCLPGYELAGEQCVACTIGKFRSTNANNSVLCEACADGFYSDTEAVAQCSACSEHCVGAERGSGLQMQVSVAGRVSQEVILPWLASTFGFAFTSEGVNGMLLDVPRCTEDHWTSRYTATDRFYYAAHPAPLPNASRSYPLLCRSSGRDVANPADILHAVIWVSDPLYFRAFSGANLSSAQTQAPHETWREGSFGQFMSSTFAPCVEHQEARTYVPHDAALCPVRVAMEPDGLEWRLWPMRLEEPALVPSAENTVTYRETQFFESSSAHGSGPFWATFLNNARVFGLDPTVHEHAYVRVDCHAAHNVVCEKCDVCEPGTFPNRTCGLVFENDRRDTECLNCSLGQVCFGGSGFAPDGSTDDTVKPLTCPTNSLSAPGATSLLGCQCLAGYFHAIAGSPSDPFTASACEECPRDHYCPFGSTAPTACPEHGFTLAVLSAVRLECHCPRGHFRNPASDEVGFNCSVCTENDFCFDSLRFNCSDELMEALPGSGFAENCTCIDTYYNNGSRCELCSVNHTCAGGVQTACAAAEWTNGRRGAAYCLCEPGFFRGASLGCELCTENYFCTGEDDERQQCPYYSTSGAATDRVSECLCDAGFGVEYDANASTAHRCRACVVREDGSGQFKEFSGNWACHECTLCDPLVQHTSTAVHCTATHDAVCQACTVCQNIGSEHYETQACQQFSQTQCGTCRLCNHTVQWQSTPCQELSNRECTAIDFVGLCAVGNYRGNHTGTKNSECLACAYTDTAYQASRLHEAVTAGEVYDDALSCRVRCLPFSRLRDPARHWLGCVTCETGNVLFKHFVQNDTACEFTCSAGYTERRNADGLDGDCVSGLSEGSAAYFAHTLNVTSVRRVPRSDAGETSTDLAAFRFSVTHSSHSYFVIVVGATSPTCTERARQHFELHCCFSGLWRISTKRQMGIPETLHETCSRASAPWSHKMSDSQLEFEIPDASLPALGTCVANRTGLDCEIVISIVDMVLFKSESRTLRLQVQRGSAHVLLNDAHRYVPLEGFAVEVQLAYFDGTSPVFAILTHMAPLAAAGTTTVSIRGVGLAFVEPASALNCGRLSIAGDAASRRNWTLEASTTAVTFMRAGEASAGHSLLHLYYTLRLADRETAETPDQMDITVWRNVSLRRAVCEPAPPAHVVENGAVFSASGLGADAVARASRLQTAEHSVRGSLGSLTSFVATSLLQHVSRVRIASMLVASALQPGLLQDGITELKQGRLVFTSSFRASCLDAGTPSEPRCAYQYLHYDPHVLGIYTFGSCSAGAQAAARAWLRSVFGISDDAGHVQALCARTRADSVFSITMVNTRAFLPQTPAWRGTQNPNTAAQSSRVFALFRFE